MFLSSIKKEEEFWEESKKFSGVEKFYSSSWFKVFFALFLAAVLIFWGTKIYTTKLFPGYAVPNKYVECLKKNEYEKAGKLLSGSALESYIAGLRSSRPVGRITDYRFYNLTGSSNLSTVDAVVEYDAGGRADVSWYRFYTAEADEGEHLIYKIAEIEPPVAGSKLRISADKKKLEDLFIKYLKLISDNSIKEAEFYLAGPALKAYRMSENHFQNAGKVLLPNVGKVKSRFLSGAKKEAFMLFEYRVSKRTVSVVVSFYKTADGWRIVNVEEV